MMKSLLVVSVCLSLSIPSGARSGPPLSNAPTSHKLSPYLVHTLRLQFTVEGRALENLALIIKVSDQVEAVELALVDFDVTFLRNRRGERIAIAGWHAVRAADLDALRALADLDAVTHIDAGTPGAYSPSWPVDGPYVEVLERAKAPTVQARRDANGNRTTGKGIVIADIDDGIDPFHPMFFNADGGHYQWFDEDGDGRLTPGVDRIDFDRDGAPDGILRLLESGFTTYGDPTPSSVDGEFTAGQDYLYYDYDEDGVRDVGPPSYGDQSPSMGEPLFIADDVDGDGQLVVQEQLVGLKTSKIKAVWTPARVYERGIDLSEHPASIAGPHGTGVAGVLVGGAPGHGDLLGIAPDADLIMLRLGDGDLHQALLVAIAYAQQEGTDVMLHEYGNHFSEFGDGSSAWELVLDGLTESGMPQLTATHNFAGTEGHGAKTIGAGETQDIAVETISFPGAGRIMLSTLRWPDADTGELEATLLLPDGTTIPLEDTEEFIGQWYVSVTTGLSDRGTGMIAFSLGRLNQAQTHFISLGDMQVLLQITNPSGQELQWQLHISDESGYSYATRILGLASNAGTMAHPSTADTAISIGAGIGNVQEDFETPNGLRYYSGRGPRIDGVQGIDIVAPTDHYSPLFHSGLGQGGPHYGYFGGTSGALPVVTAAVALLLQREPGLSPEDIRQRLAETADEDAETGTVPNNDWGAGRIQIHQLVLGEEPPVNQSPSARVANTEAFSGYEVTLDASSTSDPDHPTDTLIFRWDFDYDGTWDAEVTGDPTTRHTFTGDGELPQKRVIKLSVEDPLGYTDEVLSVVTVTAGSPPEPEPEPVPERGPDSAPVEASGDAGGTPDGTGSDLLESDTTKQPDGSLSGGCAGGQGRGGLPLGLLVTGWLALALVWRRNQLLALD